MCYGRTHCAGGRQTADRRVQWSWPCYDRGMSKVTYSGIWEDRKIRERVGHKSKRVGTEGEDGVDKRGIPSPPFLIPWGMLLTPLGTLCPLLIIYMPSINIRSMGSLLEELALPGTFFWGRAGPQWNGWWRPGQGCRQKHKLDSYPHHSVTLTLASVSSSAKYPIVNTEMDRLGSPL